MFWKKRKDQPKKINPSIYQKEDRIAEAILGLKYTVADNADADRKQERREDIGNKLLQVATLLFVILTTVGIFYQANILNKTDSAVHESAAAAKDAADAAKKSAEATTRNVDVLVNSERARLFMGNMTLTKANDTDPQPKIDFSWINLGRGAAVLTSGLVECQVTGTIIPTIPVDDERKVRRGQSVVGSGATRGSTGELPIPACTFNAPISAADWKAIEASEKYILFSGFVRYEDAFHKYKWHFGDLYIADGKFFSTANLPPAYNQETQEDQPK
jgi:hypothetical protein